MPKGLFNAIVNQVVHIVDHLAAILTNQIITYTRDYADHSPYLKHYLKKTRIIPPPVILPVTEKSRKQAFKEQNRLDTCRPVIGMGARFATEKGVEVLLDALPGILKNYPSAIVLFAGQYQHVLGEDEYAARLFPRIEEYIQSGHWKWLGILNQDEMAAFYANLDVITVPSLNSTESFGLVQIEAMMNGVPVVASNLPGVRQPVLTTGMGEVFETGNSAMLAEKICKILDEKSKYIRDPGQIIANYDPGRIAALYEDLFIELSGNGSK